MTYLMNDPGAFELYKTYYRFMSGKHYESTNKWLISNVNF